MAVGEIDEIDESEDGEEAELVRGEAQEGALRELEVGVWRHVG